MSLQSSINSIKWIPGWVKCLKLVTTITCIIGFALNSMVIFRHFVEDKTITSINKELHHDIYFPSMTLCNDTAFKTRIASFDGLQIDNFKNNTIVLKDLIWGVYSTSNDDIFENLVCVDHEMYCNAISGKFIEFNENYNSDIWHISTIYSQYRGRCYTIEYRKPVSISIITV